MVIQATAGNDVPTCGPGNSGCKNQQVRSSSTEVSNLSLDGQSVAGFEVGADLDDDPSSDSFTNEVEVNIPVPDDEAWELTGDLTVTFDADDLNFAPKQWRVGLKAYGQYVEKPTAITMPGSSFIAEAYAGRVTLTWETGTEVDNAGFNLHRAMTQDGPYTQVNETLITSEGDAASGASYSFVDTPDYGTYYYQLEDVDYRGVSTMHGLVRVTVARPLRRPLYRPSLPEF
jgi:hypothetical protein